MIKEIARQQMNNDLRQTFLISFNQESKLYAFHILNKELSSFTTQELFPNTEDWKENATDIFGSKRNLKGFMEKDAEVFEQAAKFLREQIKIIE